MESVLIMLVHYIESTKFRVSYVRII
uniref:Uncharacterized protein n=1 Tax=Rhizophora mucronata TaxID=61149 RepID=A0A2P2QWN3_RHIMU